MCVMAWMLNSQHIINRCSALIPTALKFNSHAVHEASVAQVHQPPQSSGAVRPKSHDTQGAPPQQFRLSSARIPF